MKIIMEFFKWVKGFFEEGTSQSSKRLAGIACITVGLIMSILDGFGFFTISHEILYIVMGTGALALGFSAVSRKLPTGGDR